MNTLPSPLLRRRSLLPGESLLSLIVRLSKANHYVPQSLAGGLAFAQSAEKWSYCHVDPSRSLSSRVLECLAALTQLDTLSLYASTYHVFASIITPPEINFNELKLTNSTSLPLYTANRVAQSTIRPGHTINEIFAPLISQGIAGKQFHPIRTAQFCPACLQDAPYHRLIWTPLAVAACLEHKCLLLANCHTCSKNISVYDIVASQCSTCGADLTKAETQSLDKDEFGLFSQYLIQSWLVNNSTPQNGVDLVPKQPPRVFYRIIDGLRQVIMTLENSKWSYLHQVGALLLESVPGRRKQQHVPYVNYCLYATACKGLVDWPQGFYEFLQAYKAHRTGDLPIYGGPKADLGNIYTQWLQGHWQHPAFAFVHEAFEEYFAANYWLSSPVARSKVCRNDPRAAKAFSTIGLSEAARLMGTTPRWIEHLIDTGRLTSYTLSDVGRIKFVSKTEILKLKHQREEGITLSEVASWLGVTEKMIAGMVKEGLLQAELGPVDGFSRWLFSKSPIVRLLECLTKHIRCLSAKEQMEGPLLDLVEASRLVSVVGLDAVSIFQRVAKGRLQAYNRGEDKLALGSLFFLYSDIQQCIENVKAENGWISREETMKLLGVKDSILARWVKVGLLTPRIIHKHIHFFDKFSVNQFIVEHVASDEAAQILGVVKSTVQRWARIGWLTDACVSGPNLDDNHAYLFNKEKLVRWRNERLTLSEAVDILGVSKSTLRRWIDEGRVKPLDEAKGKQRWFLRLSILQLRISREKNW